MTDQKKTFKAMINVQVLCPNCNRVMETLLPRGGSDLPARVRCIQPSCPFAEKEYSIGDLPTVLLKAFAEDGGPTDVG